MTLPGPAGFFYRSSTAVWADGASLTLTEPLDTAGAPFQLLPYTDAELAYNRAGGPNQRFAPWPGSAIESGGGGGRVFLSPQGRPRPVEQQRPRPRAALPPFYPNPPP